MERLSGKEIRLHCPCGNFITIKASEKDKDHICPVCGFKIPKNLTI